MKFPKQYYLSDAQRIDVYYNNDSSGELCPEMIAQGKPFEHQRIKETEKNKPKTMVINDWNPDHLMDPNFIDYIDELLNHGFTVLQADGEALIPITTTQHIKSNPHVVFDPTKLATLLAAHRPTIAYDAAFIFDYYHYNERHNTLHWQSDDGFIVRDSSECTLLYSAVTAGNIDIDNYPFIAKNKTLVINLNEPLDQKKLQHLIPHVNNISIDDLLWGEALDKEDEANYQKNIKCIDDTVPEAKRHELTLTPNTINQLSHNVRHAKNIAILTDQSNMLDNVHENFNGIDTFFLFQGNIHRLPQLFNETNQLKTLKLNCCTSSTPNDIIQFSALETLDIINSDDLIPHLLKNHPFVKHIKLLIETNPELDSPLSFANLITLHVSGIFGQCSMNQSVANLLTATPQLESMVLKKLNLLTLPIFTPGNLNKLKRLEIDDTAMTAELLSAILAAAPNLETLIIKYSTISGELILSPLLTVTQLVLIHTDMTIQSTTTVLTAVNSLNDLTYEVNIFTGRQLPKAQLDAMPNLESLMLITSSNVKLDLIDFMSEISALNLSDTSIALDLRSLYNTNSWFNPEICRWLRGEPPNISIPSITSVKLPTKMQGFFYLYLLRCTPTINHNHLLNTRITEALMTPYIRKFKLVRIKELIFNKKIPGYMIGRIIESSVNVETIIFEEQHLSAQLLCLQRYEYPSLPLERLKKIIIKHGDFNTMITTLIQLSPNLEDIEFDSVDNLDMTQISALFKHRSCAVIINQQIFKFIQGSEPPKMNEWGQQPTNENDDNDAEDSIEDENRSIVDPSIPPSNNTPTGPAFTPYSPQPTNDVLDDRTWSQSLLIHRLNAYLLLTYPNNPAIQAWTTKFKEGICRAIAQFHAETINQSTVGTLEQGLALWRDKLRCFKAWDGTTWPIKDAQTNLYLAQLWHYTYQNYVKPVDDTPHRMILPSMDELLKTPPTQVIYLENAWHRTSLCFKDNTWVFFDPNYKMGQAITFARGQENLLSDEIYRKFGHGLSICSASPLNLVVDLNVVPEHALLAFFNEGGFRPLLTSPDCNAVLTRFNAAIRPFNDLEGIFFVSTDGKPFWAKGILIQCDATLAWLNRYHQQSPEHCEKKLSDALNTLTHQDCDLLIAKIPASLPNTDVGQWIRKQIERRTYTTTSAPQTESHEIPAPDVKLNDTPPEPRTPTTPLSSKPVKIDRFPAGELMDVSAHTITPFIRETYFALYQQPTWVPPPRAHNQFVDNEPRVDNIPTQLTAFDTHVLANPGENKRLMFNDELTLTHYLHHLQQIPAAKTRGLFVINTIDDLKCLTSSVFINDDNTCTIKPGPSGALYDFLNTYRDHQPIIVVNWSNFSAKEVVQANTILDATRKADSILLPNGALVLGLQNMAAANAYTGSDFTSRHHQTIKVPNTLAIPPVTWPTSDLAATEEPITIDFYQDANWQRYLYGSYDLQNNAMSFKPSPLFLALKNKPTTLRIVFKNVPMHLPAFRHAINSLISESTLTYQGQTVALPSHVHIEQCNGYTFALDSPKPVFSRGYASEYDVALNPESFSPCFVRYAYQNTNNTITTLPGFIEAMAGKTLRLYVTRNLPLSAWAKLLDEAARHHCQLAITLAPHIILPDELKSLIVIEPADADHVISGETLPARLIISNDLRMTERELTASVDKIVDISELKKNDLFYHRSAKTESDHFVFDEKIKDIWNAVMAGETVVLKGRFSPDLMDTLAPLFKPDGGIYYNGAFVKPKGQLILLTADDKAFKYVKDKETKTYTFEDRIASFTTAFQAYANTHKTLLNDYSFDKLQSISAQTPYPHDPKQPWAPLHQLPQDPIDANVSDLSEKAALQFEDERFNQIERGLARMPIVFLSGKTGVGKSSFMHALANDASRNTSVFFGDIEGWATSSPIASPVSASGVRDFERRSHEQTPDAETRSENQKLILFIDEANLENTDWSMFESLFSTPRSLLYKGVYYPLTENHSIVFAGNPANYGGVRGIPALFDHHANVETFGSMNNAYLFNQVLKPCLGDRIDIAQLFLTVFQEVKRIDEQAISARELQMMGFLFKIKESAGSDLIRAKHIALDIALNALHADKQAAFRDWFKASFGELEPLTKIYPKKLESGITSDVFSLTPNHHQLYDKLDDLITVRALKQTTTEAGMQSGGMSGLVVTGSPGIGKSHFVKQYLLSKGFKEIHVDESILADIALTDKTANPVNTGFYYLPAGMNVKLKIKILNRAFHEGAVVIIDEINASDTLDVLERLINALLMGEDLQGKPPTKPGFTLLGTQNPISMAGRKEASLAVQRRLIQCHCPDYTSTDMHQILIDIGLDTERAFQLVLEFIEAKTRNKDTPPTFRALIRAAQRMLDHPAVSIQRTIQLPKACLSLMDRLDPLDASDQFLIQSITQLGVDKLFYYDTEGSLYFTRKHNTILLSDPIESNTKTTLRTALYQILSHAKIKIPNTLRFDDVHLNLELEKARHAYIIAIEKAREAVAARGNVEEVERDLDKKNAAHAEIVGEYELYARQRSNLTQQRNDASKLVNTAHDEMRRQQKIAEDTKLSAQAWWGILYDFFAPLWRGRTFTLAASEADRCYQTAVIQYENLKQILADAELNLYEPTYPQARINVERSMRKLREIGAQIPTLSAIAEEKEALAAKALQTATTILSALNQHASAIELISNHDPDLLVVEYNKNKTIEFRSITTDRTQEALNEHVPGLHLK